MGDDILDSEDKSKSVAEARHLARVHFLLKALDKLYELGMDSTNKTQDRIAALRYIADFAAEAQGGGAKTVGKLSPQAARLIAKAGMAQNGTKDISPNQAQGQRLLPGETDPGEGES